MMTAISSAVGLEPAHRPQAPLQPPMIGCWRTARCGAGRPKPTASPRRGDRGGAGETAYGGSVGEPVRVIAKLAEHPGAAPPLSDDRDHLKFLPRPARTEAAALSSSNQRETRLYPKFYRGHYELAPDINPHRSPQAFNHSAQPCPPCDNAQRNSAIESSVSSDRLLFVRKTSSSASFSASP